MREKRYEKRNKSNKIKLNGGKNYRFSVNTEAKDPFIHKVLRLCIFMEEAFEADTNDDHVGEWMVEFIAKVNGKKHHHLSVLYGVDREDVQQAMLHELRRIYTDTERIDVNIVRIEKIENEGDGDHFEELFIP